MAYQVVIIVILCNYPQKEYNLVNFHLFYTLIYIFYNWGPDCEKDPSIKSFLQQTIKLNCAPLAWGGYGLQLNNALIIMYSSQWDKNSYAAMTLKAQKY